MHCPANYARESLIAPRCDVSAAALPWAGVHIFSRILGVMTEIPHERLMRLALLECSKRLLQHMFSFFGRHRLKAWQRNRATRN
jgi:hypothetical protein